MTKRTRSSTKQPGAGRRRTILCVDPDESYAAALHGAWSQLRLADDLRIVPGQEEALTFLSSTFGKNGHCPLAAVVLDPEATGEETGPFVREIRKHCGKDAVPIVFWSQDSDKYKVLEGSAVELVLKKPMVLRLIQALDVACRLNVRSFRPFMGNSSFVHSKPSQIAE